MNLRRAASKLTSLHLVCAAIGVHWTLARAAFNPAR
jgi:hypothetical protein